MSKVNQLLQKKGSEVWTISPQSTVYQALEMMAQKNVGALLVMDKDEIAGIFSERDYARKGILKGKASKDTLVKELMTEEVSCVAGNDSTEQCMALMTERRIRHLPVIEEGKVSGLISIGDVVSNIISEQKATISHLETFIMGSAPGQ